MSTYMSETGFNAGDHLTHESETVDLTLFEWVKPMEAAMRLKCTPKTIYSRSKEGKLKSRQGREGLEVLLPIVSPETQVQTPVIQHVFPRETGVTQPVTPFQTNRETELNELRNTVKQMQTQLDDIRGQLADERVTAARLQAQVNAHTEILKTKDDLIAAKESEINAMRGTMLLMEQKTSAPPLELEMKKPGLLAALKSKFSK